MISITKPAIPLNNYIKEYF